MRETKTEFGSLKEAAEYSHVERQAIYVAIKKGQLKAEKRYIKNVPHWIIQKADVDAYRASKYNREKRIWEGEKLFDIANDKWSVLHASKVLSAMLPTPIPPAHLYYLLRIGMLRGMKKGNSWVIRRDDLINLYFKESGEEKKTEIV